MRRLGCLMTSSCLCGFSFLAPDGATNIATATSSLPLDKSRWGGKWLARVQHRFAGEPAATGRWADYERHKSKLLEHPDDPDLYLETAEALLKWIRHTTNGNFPRAASGQVDPGDSPSGKKIWREYAPEVLQLLQAAASHSGGRLSQNAKYHFLFAEASTYHSSAKGILRAALQADAVSFKRNVKPLIDHFPTYQSGVGHTFMGAFYLAAPWPIHDLSKAEVHFEAALKIDPRCRRNHYCRGLAFLKAGNNVKAQDSFRKAVRCEATSSEEEDVSEFFLRESQAVLKVLEARVGAELAEHARNNVVTVGKS